MALVHNQIDSFYNGVSKQSVNLRLPTQCEEMINVIPSVDRGTRRRNPTEFMFTPTNINEKQFSHSYDKGLSGSTAERYNITIDKTNGIKVLDVDAQEYRTVTYEGVAAAGAEIFIKAPKPKRIEVSIDVRIKTGVPFSTIVEEVRNSIAALINSNDIGKPIPISNIISNVDGIIGVEAVAITSPQYDAQNDVIRINSGEKALVLDYISDIIVSKID